MASLVHMQKILANRTQHFSSVEKAVSNLFPLLSSLVAILILKTVLQSRKDISSSYVVNHWLSDLDWFQTVILYMNLWLVNRLNGASEEAL